MSKTTSAEIINAIDLHLDEEGPFDIAKAMCEALQELIERGEGIKRKDILLTDTVVKDISNQLVLGKSLNFILDQYDISRKA